MKICRIVSGYSPYSFGGADIYAEKISKALAGSGNEEVIITINPSRGDVFEDRGNIKIYRFHPLNISTVHTIGRELFIRQGVWTTLDIYSHYAYQKIKNILIKEKPDIVHLHTPLDTTLSSFSAVKAVKLPLVFTLHDYLLLCRRVVLFHGSGSICTDKNINPLCKIYREFSKNIVNDKVDMVIAPSRFVLDMHKKYGFFKDTKAVVLSHGIELGSDNLFKTKSNDRKGLVNILYTGSLTKHKGVHILINAVKQIKNKNVKLHIVGNGIYENELKRLAVDDGSITFYGKFSIQDVQKFYALADVSVVPSVWYDVRPNVIPEAFRVGIPVIGSNIGGIPELIKDNYNGFLFEPGNIGQLKAIIEEIAENPEKLDRLGKNAYESVKELEMSKYIDKLMRVYEEAIKINKERKCAG